jgi:hypothetical protein
LLGLFNLLPFLGGWEYKNWNVEGVVTRGGRAKETMVSSNGWLSTIIMACTDCFATIKLLPMHRSQAPAVSIYPEWPRNLGLTTSTSVGWLSRYFRPDDVRTSGSFVLMVGPENASLPFVNPSKLQIELGGQSTENQAYIAVVATGIEITDSQQFLDGIAALPFFKNSVQADLAKAVSQLSGIVQGGLKT